MNRAPSTLAQGVKITALLLLLAAGLYGVLHP